MTAWSPGSWLLVAAVGGAAITVVDVSAAEPAPCGADAFGAGCRLHDASTSASTGTSLSVRIGASGFIGLLEQVARV